MHNRSSDVEAHAQPPLLPRMWPGGTFACNSRRADVHPSQVVSVQAPSAGRVMGTSCRIDQLHEVQATIVA